MKEKLPDEDEKTTRKSFEGEGTKRSGREKGRR